MNIFFQQTSGPGLSNIFMLYQPQRQAIARDIIAFFGSIQQLNFRKRNGFQIKIRQFINVVEKLRQLYSKSVRMLKAILAHRLKSHGYRKTGNSSG
jgi:hypothetical protein